MLHQHFRYCEFSNGFFENSNAFWLTVKNVCSKILCGLMPRCNKVPISSQAYFAARTAAADTICSAVVLTEHCAAFVSFQRHGAKHPPTQNANSAVSPASAAGQFSGSIANFAVNAVTTATFFTF